MDNQSANTQPNIVGMDSQNKSSIVSTLLWITCIISVILTVFLLLASRSAANTLVERTQTKQDIDSVLAGSDYTSVEANVNSFRDAYTVLSDIKATRLPKIEVMTELYKYITNDVTINNLALAADGSLVLDGSTASYRTVADFMTGLSSYKKISQAKLAAVSLNTAENVAASQKVNFSITAKLDTSKDKSSDSSTTSSETDSTGM